MSLGKRGFMKEDITRREALKKGALLGGAALVWVRPSVQTYGMSATLAAQASGTAGCTPGFWKNNTSNWPVDPKTAEVPWKPLNFPKPLVMDALGFKGGGGDVGAEQNLFRAAAAGYLNALALGGYALTESDLGALVSEAQGLL